MSKHMLQLNDRVRSVIAESQTRLPSKALALVPPRSNVVDHYVRHYGELPATTVPETAATRDPVAAVPETTVPKAKMASATETRLRFHLFAGGFGSLTLIFMCAIGAGSPVAVLVALAFAAVSFAWVTTFDRVRP
jgi:hypothetical protein